MSLAPIDWIIIIGYCLISLAIGMYFSRRASQSVSEFFLSGRSLPWWLSGTSMVATAFATDAPLAATKLVREQGLAGLWFPLSWVFADLLTLYFFARYWRRAEVTTDAEITELRYGGKPARWLRLFSGLYSALPMNIIIMGWVTLAMVKILQVSMGWSKEWVVPILSILTLSYTVMSGMWGVVATDLFQYIVATVGALALAYVAVDHVGGLAALQTKIIALPSAGAEVFNFWPRLGSGGQALTFFVVVMAVQWWAQKNVSGGGQLTQRMFACKTEKHSMLAILWFCFAHYVLRPWPWMLVALVSIIVFPNMMDGEAAYPRMIVELLPAGLKGVLIASLLAAFMSTIETHLNWGASYLVVDVYRRFVAKNKSEKHYVAVSRGATILLMILTGFATFAMDSIVGAWKFLATLTAGVGPVFILRWYWWRINAWSEISALAASGFFSTVLLLVPGWEGEAGYPVRLLCVLALTTATWLSVTFLTAPEAHGTLRKFFTKVRPPAMGWKPIATPQDHSDTAGILLDDTKAYLAAVAFMVSGLFFIGKYLLGQNAEASLYGATAVLSGYYLWIDMKRRTHDFQPSRAVQTKPSQSHSHSGATAGSQ